MTWREWCNSDYNTIGAYALEGVFVAHTYNGETHYIYRTYSDELGYNLAELDAVIEEGHQYLCMHFGGL
jgi:hypothetical protein